MLSSKHFILTLSLLFCSSLANAQALWQGATYGMSPSEVKTAFPDAKAPEGNAGRLSAGEAELLRIEQVRLVSQDFSASFYFKGESLSQVTLTLKKGQPFSTAMLVFESLTEALRAKYGPEVSRKIDRSMLNTANAIWLSGRTNIALVAMAVGTSPAILNVNYQVRVAEDADKL